MNSQKEIRNIKIKKWLREEMKVLNFIKKY